MHGFEGAIFGPPFYSRHVPEMVHDAKWFETEYADLVGDRKACVETALNNTALHAESRAIVSTLAHWWGSAPKEQIFSLAVYCESPGYGVCLTKLSHV